MDAIICGFAGIGKSYLALNQAGFVDLESTPFEKDWALYVQVALHMQKNGYKVMLSCHKDLRKELKKRNAEYIVVIPKKEHKQAYIQRYKNRGNTQEFVELFEKNFEIFINEIKRDEANILEIEQKQHYLWDSLVTRRW